MPNEIYLILKTALTSEEFDKVEKHINDLQGRIDDVIHYLNMMLPENEDAFYCVQRLEGHYSAMECGRKTYDDHIPHID